ncbi:10960_t:CDS:10, partial [Acaulospora colombiana]
PVKLLAENQELIVHEAPSKTLKGWENFTNRDLKIPKPHDSARFDIGVVVSFGYFLTPRILESFTKGALNVHPSLLPKHRGASPIQYAIMSGDEETGVTIQELHPKIFDAGRIFRQITVPLPPLSTYLSLGPILAAKGSELLVDTLRYFDYYKANSQEQDEAKSTKAPKISKDMALIKWDQTSAKQLDRLHRAISHQKFIQRCAADYKLGALYVLDSISQAAQRQKTLVSEKDGDGISSWSGAEYLERFEKILEEMFSNIMQCPDHDKEKVKRVLDIWLSKDDIYDKEMIRKIKDTYFSQRDATKPLENNVSISVPTTSGPMVGVVPTPINPTSTVDQATLNPTALDSSALLATLNDLTQGTLNIPSFLSSNPITSATSQPINNAIAFNNVTANPIPQQVSLSAASQFTNMNMSSSSLPLNTVSQPPVSAPVPASNGFLQTPLSSSNYTKVVTNNTNTTKGNASVNDPLDFDYGDMDEDEDPGATSSAPNGEINNGAEKNLTSAINVQPVNVSQPTASITPTMTQDQYQIMNNQFAPPQVSQGVATDANQSIPPTPVPPSLIPSGQPQAQPNQSMPPTSVAPFNYPPPTQPWVAPAQQPPPSNVLPPPQGQFQAPPPFPVPPWNGQQTIPQPPWNSNSPSFPVPPTPRPQPGSFPTQFPGQPGPQQGFPAPPPGLPNHPIQHQGPPGPPPPLQGPPGAQSMGHVMQHHQGPPAPQPLVPPGPNPPQGPPGQLEPPPMSQPEVSIAYEDQSIGRDYIKETDRKWLLTSKCGGTSGRPVIGGIVVEEPDIVIGEGFSSGSSNKKLGSQFENPRVDRRSGRSNSKDVKQWTEKSSDATYQGQFQLSEKDYLSDQQQPYVGQPHAGSNGQDSRLPLQQTQSDFNSTLPSQDQLFQQRQEKSSPQPFPHKREHFGPQKDEHYRENKRSRWDK